MSEQPKRITLHPYQTKAWNSTSRFVALIAGTGGGKTWFGPYWLYREIAKNPQGRFMVVAPTYKVLMRATASELVKAFQGTDVEGRFLESRMVYELPTGGIIYFCSADKPKYLEGGQINAAWLDEAGQMTRWAWVVMQARLGVSQGRALLTTTPYGKNWLFTEFYKRWLKGDTDYFVVQYSSAQNPYYSKAEFDRMRDSLTPTEFAIRYMGEFDEVEGLVYPGFDKCVVPEPIYKFNQSDTFVGGLDPGWSAPCCMLTAAVDDKGVVHIIDEVYESKLLLGSLAQKMNRNATYFMDPAAKREFEELSSLTGSGNLRPAINDIRPGIMKVHEFIKQGRLVVPESVAPNLISEAGIYTFKQGKDAPQLKGDDHALDALRYLLMGLDSEAGGLEILMI